MVFIFRFLDLWCWVCGDVLIFFGRVGMGGVLWLSDCVCWCFLLLLGWCGFGFWNVCLVMDLLFLCCCRFGLFFVIGDFVCDDEVIDVLWCRVCFVCMLVICVGVMGCVWRVVVVVVVDNVELDLWCLKMVVVVVVVFGLIVVVVKGCMMKGILVWDFWLLWYYCVSFD